MKKSKIDLKNELLSNIREDVTVVITVENDKGYINISKTDKAYLKSVLVEIDFTTDTVNIKSRLSGKKLKYCEKPDNISQFILDKTNVIFDVKNLNNVYEKLTNFINNNKNSPYK